MSQFFYNWKRLRRRGFSGIIGGQDHKFGGYPMTILKKETKDNNRVELTIRV